MSLILQLTSLTMKIVTISIACLLALVTLVASDLTSTEFNQLLSQSELIVTATVEEFNSDDLGKGTARFDVNEVHKGQLSNKKIILSWSTEVHAQRIEGPGEYLLFLRYSNSKEDLQIGPTHQATHYGRSYWPVETIEGTPGCRRVTHYVYPINMVDIKKVYLVSGQVKDNKKKDGHNLYVCIDRVLKKIGQKCDK